MIKQVKPIWLVWINVAATAAAVALFYSGSPASAIVGMAGFGISLVLLVDKAVLNRPAIGERARAQLRLLRWMLAGVPRAFSLAWVVLLLATMISFIRSFGEPMQMFGILGVYLAYSGLIIAWATARTGPFAAPRQAKGELC